MEKKSGQPFGHYIPMVLCGWDEFQLNEVIFYPVLESKLTYIHVFCSLGGLGVLALVIQDNTGFKAGYTQLLVDAAIFTVAIFIFPASVVAYSVLGAVVLNGVIAFNHRRDRYVAP